MAGLQFLVGRRGHPLQCLSDLREGHTGEVRILLLEVRSHIAGRHQFALSLLFSQFRFCDSCENADFRQHADDRLDSFTKMNDDPPAIPWMQGQVT